MEKPIVKFVKEKYSKDSDIKKLFRYVTGQGKHKKAVGYYSGRGVSNDPDKAAEQMISVQKILGKDNKRRIYHMVVSYRCPNSSYWMNRVKSAAKKIADELYKKYQLFYSIHTDTENIHCHVCFSAVSYIDGKKWHKQRTEFKKFCEEIATLGTI